ncbi:MAG: adenosylcobinamide-phosphate synthase CbiB [Coriobacteriales bacterium]|jgi:adenosylcobinamide-phosphate synthase
MTTVLCVVCGFLLDLALGDPRWMPHPVVAMGRSVTWLERHLRPRFPDTPGGQLAAGAVVAVVVPAASCALAAGVLCACELASHALRVAVEAFMCYQLLATHELWRQTMLVRAALLRGDLAGARRAVSMVVGRDTDALDEAGVARAAVETVAENASDGVVAPLLYMVVAGAPGAMLYKAINTLDSMIGYDDERYRYFGRVAARVDDVANWVPARLTALCMVVVAPVVGLSGRGAWRVWRRDRRRHASPNSAQGESAMAGALGVRLGGGATYGGVLVSRPTLGDPGRPVEADDIARANRLMLACCVLALALLCACRVAALAAAGALS